MMNILLEEYYFYTFYEAEGRFLLTVVCGTVAVFDVTIALSSHEIKRFQEEGKAYIDTLANQILYAPDNFLDRRI